MRAIGFDAGLSPDVSVVIVGWRDAPLLTSCLRSLADARSDVSFEVILVLNEPSRRLVEELRRTVSGADVTVFRSNLGFGAAVNFGAQRARGRYLALLNDDCVVEQGWLDALVDLARRRPRAAVVGSTFVHPDGSLQEAGSIIWADGSTVAVGDGADRSVMRFERRVDYCSGGAVLIVRHVWDSLGGLDDRYYPAYFEDVDLCLRVAETGWEVWYQPQSTVRHVRSASSTAALRTVITDRSRRAFVERWSEQLADRRTVGEEEAAIWHAMGRPLRVLVIDDILPDTSVGSGFGRMVDTLRALSNEPDLHVMFHPRVPDATVPDELVSMGVRVVADLERHLTTPGVGVDVVVVSRPHNAEIFRPLIDRLMPTVPVIYDAEALYFRRELMQSALTPDSAGLRAKAEVMRETEFDLCRWADHVVCISEDEAKLIREITPKAVSVVEPWLVGPRPTEAPFAARTNVGFVAGWLAGPTSPNADGLLWFAREVLPIVRAAVPGCRLLVTGSNPPANVSWLAGPAVEFVGRVEDLWGFYDRIRVAISPTRFGAGIKLKTIEAIQHGVPVVCTSEAANGLEPETAGAVLTGDDPRAFGMALIDLLTDRRTWEAARGRELAAASTGATRGAGTDSWPRIVRDTAARPSLRKVHV